MELYFNEQGEYELNGKNNSSGITCDGLVMTVEPNQALGNEIAEILREDEDNFPFEFYTVSFNTFEGRAYSGYKRYLKHILIEHDLNQ